MPLLFACNTIGFSRDEAHFIEGFDVVLPAHDIMMLKCIIFG